uniref:Uncharacterized protein n=1 Tax=Sphaerodactylus townsendi TaxID=933632 RepID=A0ACB8G5Q6_9SAUR
MKKQKSPINFYIKIILCFTYIPDVHITHAHSMMSPIFSFVVLLPLLALYCGTGSWRYSMGHQIRWTFMRPAKCYDDKAYTFFVCLFSHKYFFIDCKTRSFHPISVKSDLYIEWKTKSI